MPLSKNGTQRASFECVAGAAVSFTLFAIGRSEPTMNINLVLATGLAYAFIGALIMFASHRSIYNSASRIVAGYPKVLAGLRAQRHDGRFGLIVLFCGSALQVFAACGYSAPLAYWRYPACAVLAVLAVYGLYRLIIAHRVA